MSLASILKSIWATISSLWNKLEPEFKKAIHIGVLVTDNVKNFVDSPEADILTAIIPGDVDDKVKDVLRAELPNIVIKLRLVEAGVDTSDPVEIMKSAIAVIKSIDPSVKGDFLDGLAVAIAQVTADGELTWSDAKYLLKWYYDHQYKPQDGNATN